MSSRKTYSLSLSDKAIEDFRDILSYTMQMWGARQVEEYSTILHKALTAIEQDPPTEKHWFKIAQSIGSYSKYYDPNIKA